MAARLYDAPNSYISAAPDTSTTPPTLMSLAPVGHIAPVVSRIEASGCLDQLSKLPAVKIEECSQLVAEAVLSIAQFQGNPDTPLNSRQNMLVEQLRLAAANVCRARWAIVDTLTFSVDDPACAVSTIVLASNS